MTNSPKIYLPGQIQKKYRGDNAVVITPPKEGEERYSFLQVPILDKDIGKVDKDFIYVTGVYLTVHPVERIYVGLSVEGCKVFDDLATGRKTLRDVDLELIIGYFLNDKIREASNACEAAGLE